MGKLWYIRHGETDFNLAKKKYLKGNMEYSNYKKEWKYCDPPLNGPGAEFVWR